MQRFVHLYPHSASLATSRAVIATFAAFLTVFEVAFTSTQGPLKQFLSQFPIGGLTSPGYQASFSCGLGSYQRSSTCAFALFQRLTLYGCAGALLHLCCSSCPRFAKCFYCPSALFEGSFWTQAVKAVMLSVGFGCRTRPMIACINLASLEHVPYYHLWTILLLLISNSLITST